MDSRRDDEVATKRDLDLLKQELIEKIDGNSTKIDANGQKISRLIVQVVENHDAIGKMLTREEYKRDYNRLLQGQDEMMGVLLRID